MISHLRLIVRILSRSAAMASEKALLDRAPSASGRPYTLMMTLPVSTTVVGLPPPDPDAGPALAAAESLAAAAVAARAHER